MLAIHILNLVFLLVPVSHEGDTLFEESPDAFYRIQANKLLL